jgi:hypothetical protein
MKLDVAYDMAVPPLEIEGVHDSTEDEENKTGENKSSGETIALVDDLDEPNESLYTNEEQEYDKDKSDEEEERKPRITRLDRIIREPTRLIAELGVTTLDYEIKLTAAEDHYYKTMCKLHKSEFIAREIKCVGTGKGPTHKRVK